MSTVVAFGHGDDCLQLFIYLVEAFFTSFEAFWLAVVAARAAGSAMPPPPSSRGSPELQGSVGGSGGDFSAGLL